MSDPSIRATSGGIPDPKRLRSVDTAHDRAASMMPKVRARTPGGTAQAPKDTTAFHNSKNDIFAAGSQPSGGFGRYSLPPTPRVMQADELGVRAQRPGAVQVDNAALLSQIDANPAGPAPRSGANFDADIQAAIAASMDPTQSVVAQKEAEDLGRAMAASVASQKAEAEVADMMADLEARFAFPSSQSTPTSAGPAPRSDANFDADIQAAIAASMDPTQSVVAQKEAEQLGKAMAASVASQQAKANVAQRLAAFEANFSLPPLQK